MKRILIFLLFAFALTVYAQQQSGEGQAEETPATPAVEDCERAGDEPVDTTDPAVPGAEGETGDEQLSGNCEEQDEAQGSLDENDLVQETEPAEVPLESNPDDEDFRPGEEISEDYPVALPSDI